MIESLGVIHSDDVALWCWDSACIEKVLVCRGAQWLLPADVILRQGAISYLKSQNVEVVGHLSGKLKLWELQFVFDLKVIAYVNGARLPKSEILIHIPPCRQPA